MKFPISFRASAPSRLDFAGAWTDVSPFVDRHRGAVVNAAIELRATAMLTPGGDGYRLRADDLGEQVTLTGANALAGDGELSLLRAALRASRVGPCELHTSAQAPAGSGLGSSGAMGVALVGAIDGALQRERPPASMAEAAWQVETVEAGIAGGRQDQYAAAHGGFNHMSFRGDGVSVRPLAIEPDFADALARQTVLCYTGRSRFSSQTITRVMAAFTAGEASVRDALGRLVELGDRMADALESSDLAAVGRLLSANWSEQQRLDSGMRTPAMAELEAAMGAAGILGCKAAGSGAGGCIFFIVENAEAAIRFAQDAGAIVLPVEWAWSGVQCDAVTT